MDLDLDDGVHAFGSSLGTVCMTSPQALVASAIPVKPPSDWFNDPKLGGVSPLTITADGQVKGHIAAWHTSHIGMAGSIKPPKSRSNYAFFKTGVIETDSGSFVDVGQITLTGGHADLGANVASAVAHYDNTKSAIMDVNTGEDRHGIWVAGALRPGVTDEQIRIIRASAVSGDWRPINGRLELVAVCAVNTPGFPIPRARVASGTPIAMVAAGIEPIIEQAMRVRADRDIEAGIEAGLGLFRERIRNVEAILASGQIEQLRERVHAPVVASGSTDNRVADLRRRVRPEGAVTASASPDVEDLRRRVHSSSF